MESHERTVDSREYLFNESPLAGFDEQLANDELRTSLIVRG